MGLKRPLPPVKDIHIVVNQLDTEERQTPYYFAMEKPKFVKRIQEMSIVRCPGSDDDSGYRRGFFVFLEPLTKTRQGQSTG
jgi:hypothetical protein